MPKKERLDVQLVNRGLSPSREQARAVIMAGLVLVDGERQDKPGSKWKEDAQITVKGQPHPYVSRGGLKLEQAIRAFQLDLSEKVVLDIGASTGGFTDCALQHGAKLVYAIDVGYGQLAWRLRNDPRVVVMERVNFRHMQPQDLSGEPPQFACIDVSFISLRIILPVLLPFFTGEGEVVCLIKPQFEAGRENVGKKGIVRDPAVHESVLRDIIALTSSLGLKVAGLTHSPVRGGEGNIEFLCYLRLDQSAPTEWDDARIERTVAEAHRIFRDGE